MAAQDEHDVDAAEGARLDQATAAAEHRANAPAPPTDDVSLLDHLPLTEIDLNQLADDRLRRFSTPSG